MPGKSVSFTKMSGSGNDFVVIDNRKKIIKNPVSFAQSYCHRKFGIGADGLLLVENSSQKQVDFKMIYFNSDGSRASFCGNGARCISLFSYLKKIAPQKMQFESDSGIISAEIMGTSSVNSSLRVGAGLPAQYNVKIKMPEPRDIREDFNINVSGKNIEVSFINTGVPHTIIFIENIKNVDVENLGKKVRWNEKFKPQGTNVDFVKIINKHKLQIRTYERGVEGETLACGTGVVASSIISILKKYVSSPVNVLTQGGEVLKVYYDGSDAYFEGRISLVFEGKI